MADAFPKENPHFDRASLHDLAKATQHITTNAIADDAKSDPGTRPVRSTRGVLPLRYRDVVESKHSLSIKKVRTTQAANLTRLCTKARKAIDEFRSKATLSDFLDNINESVSLLNQTNATYMDSLDSVELKNSALMWMQDRHETAEEVLAELQEARHSSKVPSHTRSSYASSEVSHSSHSSLTSEKLKLEAQKAELEVKKAELRARQSELEAQDRIVKAKTKANKLRLMTDAATYSESQEAKHQKDTHDQVILNDEHVTCHQDLLKPTSTHYDNNSESIDSWIDKLVIGEETSYSLRTDCHAEKDYLTRAIITLESERDLPKIELPLFSGQALV